MRADCERAGSTDRLAEAQARIDAKRRADEQRAKQRAKERAAVEAEIRGILCTECGESVNPARWLVEKGIEWRLRHRTKPLPKLLCDACKERNRRAAAAKAEKERLARRRESIVMLMAQAGVPEKLRTARLDRTPDLPAALAGAVRQWARRPDGFLVLSGAVGAGKSYLAASVLREVIWDDRWGVWTAEGDFLAGVRREYGNVVTDMSLAECRFLVYDDLLTGFFDDLRTAAVEELIRRRYDAGRPTLITTNASIDTIESRLGARVASVLAEGRRVLALPARDLRQEGSLSLLGTDESLVAHCGEVTDDQGP